MLRTFAAPAFAILTAALAGCGSLHQTPWTADTEFTGTASIQRPKDVKFYPSDHPVRMGQEFFNRGDFGNAERNFREAVEKAPEDTIAWIGLAASYDRIGRFDMADRAYEHAIKTGGQTAQTLNNLGYSYMLRGDLVRARKKFEQALECEPDNRSAINNLELLNGSYKYIEREPVHMD